MMKSIDTGADLLTHCREGSPYSSACRDIIRGAFEELTVRNQICDIKTTLPSSITDDEAVEIVIDYLRCHPDDLDLWSDFLATEAFLERWP